MMHADLLTDLIAWGWKEGCMWFRNLKTGDTAQIWSIES